jgi:hypothetical protein
MRNHAFAALLVAVLGLAPAGCRHEQAPPPLPPRLDIIGAIEVLPRSIITDTTGTPDADRRTYVALVTLDSAVSFYRGHLTTLSWSILGDQADAAAGKHNLYATRDSLTLWVHLQQRGADSTEVTIIGSARQSDRGQPVPPAVNPQRRRG